MMDKNLTTTTKKFVISLFVIYGILLQTIALALPVKAETKSNKPLRKVRPIVECVFNNGNGALTAWFGYNNLNDSVVSIGVGANNRFTPSPQNRGQITNFRPARQKYVFHASQASGDLTWNLDGLSDKASLTNPKYCSTFSLTIDSPENDTNTINSTINLSGSAYSLVPNSGGISSVSVNGTPANFDSNSHIWSYTNFPLNIGRNVITVRVVDGQGNEDTKNVRVYREDTSPTIESIQANTAFQGQTLQVNLTGKYTNWAAGQTSMSFGGEVSVGGENEGNLGPVNVIDATHATAGIIVNPKAALGYRRIRVVTNLPNGQTEEINLPEGVGEIDEEEIEEIIARKMFTVLPVNPPGNLNNNVTTIAGSAGERGFADGTGSQARFKGLSGIAVGNDDAVYIADSLNNRIRVARQQSDNSWSVQTIAGSETAGFQDGVGNQALFNTPRGAAVSANGTIYIADTGNHSIRKILPDGTVSTFAGNGTSGFQDGAGNQARFSSPEGLSLDSSGNIYVADTANSAVRKIDPNGNVITLAGDGTPGSNDSPSARFKGLSGVVVDGTDVYIYIADSKNHLIRKLDTSGTVTTIAGNLRGFADGTAQEARFARPTGIAIDSLGRFIIADKKNALIRSITPDNNSTPLSVSTIAGAGTIGSADGTGDVAKFKNPKAIAVSRSSAIFVADSSNHTIRRIGLPPRIFSFAPTSGRIGDTVIISGENFDARGNTTNTVTFARTGGGTINAPVTNAANTALTVIVPNEAATGKITVTTQDGTVISINDFVVNEAFLPQITDFNPRRGQVGTAVKLTGTDLKTGNSTPLVNFAGADNTRLNALVTSSTATEVNVLVPNGAITGRIELTNSIGSAQTSQDFVVDETQEFQVTVSPATIEAVERTQGTAVVSLTSSNSTFTQLAALTALSLPSGVTAEFEPAQITAGGTSTLKLDLGDSSLSSGSHQFTVRATAIIDGREVSKDTSVSLSIITAGQTTISGRVLNTDSEPVIGATVSLDGITTTTDSSGSFILSGVTAGQARPLQIDGRTASAPNRTYPVITEPADIVAGQANQVPYIFYLPPIDTQYEVEVVPGQITLAGNPKVEGLQMTIPPNANLRNRDGSPVTRVSITPLAIDRTPTPLPPDVKTGLVYTSQPGGALTDVPIPVIYPNLLGLDPDTQVELYAFNHDTVEWYIYGYGRVSADGKTIAPEINPSTGQLYGLQDFSWHFPNAGEGGNPGGGGGDSCPVNVGRNPVDYSTGIKLESATDISFGGARGGIVINREYSSDNSGLAIIGRYGRGWKDNYEIQLTGSWTVGGAGRVVRPDEQNGRLFNYNRTETDGSLIFSSTSTVSHLSDTVRKLTNGTFEYRYGYGESMKFNSAGRMTAIIDPNGNTTTLSYSGNNLTQITDAVGRTVSFEYDGSGKVTRITDPLNRSWIYGYSNAVAFGILDSVTDPLGNVTRYNYSTASGIRLSSITDPNGNPVKQIRYNLQGRVISQQFADGGIETYEYQMTGGIVTQTIITDPLGRKMTKRFNANGYVIEQIDELGQRAIIDRNLNNNLPNSTVGSCGCTEESRQFDARGNKTQITDQQGNITRFEYEPIYNNVTKVTDKLNRQTMFSYDATGNLTNVTDVIGRTSAMAYDQFGRVVSTTDALNQTETYEYDQNGFMNARVDKLGKRWTMSYDTVGRMLAQTDPLGRTMSYTYDDFDRIITITDANNATTTFGYDANSNRISVNDALNRTWRMSYDTKNRLTKTTDPIGRIRRTEYDSADQMKKTISPSGRTIRYEYDERGQMVKMFDGLDNSAEFNYDYEKKLVSLKNERGYLTTFEYDTLDRPILQRNPLGQTSTVEYDALGNLTKATDELGRVTTLSYDTVNRLQTVNYADAQVAYTYDNLNRPTQVTDTQGGSINWSYDALGQVLSETTANSVVGYSYNDARQRTSLNVQGRPNVNYSYDTAGRLASITQGAESFNYSYDLLSRMESLTRPNGVTTSYEYDTVNRLKRLKHFSASQTIEDLQYGYNSEDEISSISSLNSATLLPSAKTASTANDANRISQLGNASYSFDDEGQTTTKTDSSGSTIYNWDARGRMTSANLPNGNNVSYSYDALGRRNSRTANNQTTSFIYDGQDIVQDKQGANIEADYVNGFGIDDKLRVSNTSSGSLYFLKDHLGSTQGLTGVSGNVAEWQRYEAFGQSSVANSLTRYGYTGRERDEQTGLNYYRARWYDAEQGRFVSSDPIGFAGGTLNLYEYAKNKPLMITDPYGESVPIWDHYWYWHYSKKCAESGIKSACAVNGPNQSQEDLERMAQEAFNRGVGSVSGLRFKVGYADNPDCRQMEYYAGKVYADSFPTNVQRVDPGGSVTQTAENVAKTQLPSKAKRAWDWITSWF